MDSNINVYKILLMTSAGVLHSCGLCTNTVRSAHPAPTILMFPSVNQHHHDYYYVLWEGEVDSVFKNSFFCQMKIVLLIAKQYSL
jgi:hypothetical protein